MAGASTGGSSGAAVSPVKIVNQSDKTFSAGTVHSAAIKTDGSLYTWGSNLQGQLGTGTLLSSLVSQLVPSTPTWSLVSAGSQFTIGLRSDGTFWTWGYNTNGQLGQSLLSNVTVATPTKLTLSAVPKDISAGEAHAAMVLVDGSLWTWGRNASGQLGQGTTTDLNHPVQVGALKTWDSVSAGGTHTLAKKDGYLWGWGDNTSNQLGLSLSVPPSPSSQTTPIQINLMSDPVAVFSAGGAHSLAIGSTGALWSWGSNSDGQACDGSNPINNAAPAIAAIRDTGPWLRVAAGGYHSLAIKADGSLWSCGSNLYGQLGNGQSSATGNAVLTRVGTDNTWVAIAAGKYHSMALKADGSLWVWGRNDNGQLGLGNSVSPITSMLQLH